MDVRLLYRFLQLESFSDQELNDVFDRIRQAGDSSSLSSSEDGHSQNIPDEGIGHRHFKQFLLERIRSLEQEHPQATTSALTADDFETANRIEQQRQQYADQQASQLLRALLENSDDETLPYLTRDQFSKSILAKASRVDFEKTLPITISMLLVGSSVGIITPVMPFVVQSLQLSSGQYGIVVSAFALAKMAGNVPSAILVERHGRKPYLVYSLSLIAVGVGGIGLASSFEHLWLCRLLTGFGVAALSTAATMSIADLSTPKNRASTMAPIMSAFAAGTALGPAIGGMLADNVGVNPTFYLVGVSYLALTGVNQVLLKETKTTHLEFPWQQQNKKTDSLKSSGVATMEKLGVLDAVKSAVGQWVPLLSDARVRNVVIMNGFYWIALAGSQMTLLPLMLTDPDGMAMTATSVGQVYMGMSAVQVFGNPILARYVDKMGKAPAIVLGCTLISSSMALLPLCSDIYQLAAPLGVWAAGSTMLSTAPVAYISDTVDEEKRAQAIALLRTAGDVGFLCGATGMGALADFTGDMDVAMQTGAGVLLTATGWYAARQFLSYKLSSR